MLLLALGLGPGQVAEAQTSGDAITNTTPKFERAPSGIGRSSGFVLVSDNSQSDSKGSATESDSEGQENGKDTAVLWRGFRHAWSYNHRVNRLGSWVRTEDCGEQSCSYSVGHSGASGTGKDDASFRDAYTELSAKGVGFHSGEKSNIPIQGTEATPDNGNPGTDEMISGTATIEVNLPSDMTNKDTYAVLLNGFDLKSKGLAAKFIRFNLDVTSTSVSGGTLTTNIDYDVLLDCDSMECKGPIKKNGKWRGGKKRQDVNYRLDIHYLAIGGNDERVNIVRGSELENDYQWARCEDEIQNPSEKNQEDKWDRGFGGFEDGDSLPKDRMYCEGTKYAELDHREYYKTQRIDGKEGFTVGVVGIGKMYLDTHNHEAHFVQYTNVVGGDYDTANGVYDVSGLPFFKEWSSRPGKYPSASTSYGHAGGATVKTEPVLVQIRDGCKRSFVNGGGLHWPGGGKDAIDADQAVETKSNLSFSFGEHWAGYGGRGNLCSHESKGRVDHTSYAPENSAFTVGHTEDGKTAWQEFQPYNKSRSGLITQRTAEDPTQLRGRVSDRYLETDRSGSTSSLSFSVKQAGNEGEIPLSGISRPYVTRSAGFFQIDDASPYWPTVRAAPTANDQRFEAFLQNLTTGETQWLGTSVSGAAIRKTIDSGGTYAIETVFDGVDASPTTAITTLQIAEHGELSKDLDWTIRGDWKGTAATRSFSYDWQSGEHPRSRPGWKLNVSTPDGGGGVVVSAPFEVHAFAEEFGVEARGDPPILDTHVEVNGRNSWEGDRWPKGSYQSGGDYELSIFSCYNVLGVRIDNSGDYECRSAQEPGVREEIEQTIKVGDAYGPEQPDVSVVGLTRQQGSGVGHVDYNTQDETLTFSWRKPEDRGAPSLNIPASGLARYEIEVSADGGQSETVAESTFGENLAYAERSGDYREITYSFRRSGYHEFRLRAVDLEGNRSPATTVKLCVNDADCETPGEKAVAAEEAERAIRNAMAADRMSDWLDRLLGAMGDGDDPGAVLPSAPDVGFDPGDPVPCKVCTPGNLNWMPRGERVNVHVRQESRTVSYHALLQDGYIVRLGGPPLDNPTREVMITSDAMRSIAESQQPLQLMTQVVRNPHGTTLSQSLDDPRSGGQSETQRSSGQLSDEVAVALLAKAGALVSRATNVGEVAGDVGSAFGGSQAALSYGGSIAFGSRDGRINFRLTGLSATGAVFSTTEGFDSDGRVAPNTLLLLTGDLVIRPVPRLLVQPYAIGGVGVEYHSFEPSGGVDNTQNADSGLGPSVQIGLGADVRLANMTLGFEVVDYISGVVSDGGLHHGAFVLAGIGIPLF
jgi:hypothetical protein